MKNISTFFPRCSPLKRKRYGSRTDSDDNGWDENTGYSRRWTDIWLLEMMMVPLTRCLPNMT